MNGEIYRLDEKRANIMAVADTGVGMFAEAAEAYLECTKDYEFKCAKIEAYSEATDRELQINLAKAEYKCYTENGTVDDLLYLEAAAEDGALQKIRNLIDAAIAAFQEWISKIKTRVLKTIASAEARKTLNTASKRVKLNPFLAKKKVQILNTKKALSVINAYKSKADKMASRLVVKGLVAEGPMKTLGDTKEAFRQEFKGSIVGTAAMTTITIAALLTKLSSDIERLPSYIDKIEAQNTAVLKKLKGTISPEAAASAQAATNAAINFRNELVREEVNTVIDGVMDEIKALKSNVMKAKGNEPMQVVKPKITKKGKVKVKPVAESAEEDDTLFDESDYTENVDDLLFEEDTNGEDDFDFDF